MRPECNKGSLTGSGRLLSDNRLANRLTAFEGEPRQHQ